jgi:hypothetical protein
MVYDWDEYKETCYRLYIDERKSLRDIMEFMRVHHNFMPRSVTLHLFLTELELSSCRGEISLSFSPYRSYGTILAAIPVPTQLISSLSSPV